ncbi:hypothetical protein E4U59_003964, partial [Claviceps monticola]
RQTQNVRLRYASPHNFFSFAYKTLQSAHAAIATKQWDVEEIAALYKSIRVSDDEGTEKL